MQDANLVQLLCKAGATLDLVDKENHTCLDIASPSLSTIMRDASTKQKMVRDLLIYYVLIIIVNCLISGLSSLQV